MNFTYIDTDQALLEFCQQVDNCSFCALDTEFLREKTYYPLLALIQLATETQQACIDPLAITDFSPLVRLFQNEKMLKILHSPSQDLELFFQQFDALPKPVFDTQLAAAVLGYANQIGYADLVNRVCKVQLEKKYTRADWSKRPLSEGELDYAMDDVRYLIQIYQTLTDDMQRLGRSSWLQQDFERLSDKSSYEVDMGGLWKRLKGVNRLKGAALNNADHLCRWREQRAIKSNRPKRWIIKDEDIVDIARFNPKSHEELNQIGNLGAEFVRKNGDALIEVLQQASSVKPADYPRLPDFTRLTTEQQAISDCLMAICRLQAEKNEIALASVTSKKEIDGLVAGNRDSKISKGWRYEMIGKILIRFLEGEIGLKCVDGRLEF